MHEQCLSIDTQFDHPRDNPTQKLRRFNYAIRMGIRIIPTVIGSSITLAVVRVMTTLNIERAAETSGNDTILLNIWEKTTQFLDYIFDPAGAWMIWFFLGLTAGNVLYNYGRNFEDKMRGQQGGPPFWYLRTQAHLVRFGIRFRWFQRLNRDLDTNLENLSRILTELHGFPKLPASHFGENEDQLRLTSEYLRLITPNLSARFIDEAKAAANRFDKQPKEKRLERLNR